MAIEVKIIWNERILSTIANNTHINLNDTQFTIHWNFSRREFHFLWMPWGVCLTPVNKIKSNVVFKSFIAFVISNRKNFCFTVHFLKRLKCENGKTGSSCRNLLRIRIRIRTHNQIPNEMKMKMNFYMLCTHAAREWERETETTKLVENQTQLYQ